MRKNLVFYPVIAVMMLVILEIFAFVVVQVIDRDDLFDHRGDALERLDADELAKFAGDGGDPVVGWRNPLAETVSESNCQGTSIEYRFDQAGARRYRGFDPKAVEVIIVGDSYTKGDEVADDDAYPARLAAQLGVGVANHGVGGYGPTQSVLNLNKKIAVYPQAKVVVLGIMYENVYRMMNSYRPVLYGSSAPYSLKPHMAGGGIVAHPGEQVLTDLERFVQAANKAFDNDFWAKPEPRFPYIVSLLRSLDSNYFRYRKLQKQFRKLGVPEYFMIFAAEPVRRNLVGLLNEYSRTAVELGLQPVVLFIPRNHFDTTSASRFIRRHQAEIDPRLLVGDVGEQSGVDWERFNYREPASDNICHPSVYGYQVIADYLADLLRAGELGSAARGSLVLTHR